VVPRHVRFDDPDKYFALGLHAPGMANSKPVTAREGVLGQSRMAMDDTIRLGGVRELASAREPGTLDMSRASAASLSLRPI